MQKHDQQRIQISEEEMPYHCEGNEKQLINSLLLEIPNYQDCDLLIQPNDLQHEERQGIFCQEINMLGHSSIHKLNMTTLIDDITNNQMQSSLILNSEQKENYENNRSIEQLEIKPSHDYQVNKCGQKNCDFTSVIDNNINIEDNLLYSQKLFLGVDAKKNQNQDQDFSPTNLLLNKNKPQNQRLTHNSDFYLSNHYILKNITNPSEFVHSQESLDFLNINYLMQKQACINQTSLSENQENQSLFQHLQNQKSNQTQNSCGQVDKNKIIYDKLNICQNIQNNFQNDDIDNIQVQLKLDYSKKDFLEFNQSIQRISQQDLSEQFVGISDSQATTPSDNISQQSNSPVCTSFLKLYNKIKSVKSNKQGSSNSSLNEGIFETQNLKKLKDKKLKLTDLALNKLIDGNKRQKKSKFQLEILEKEFITNPNWDYTKKAELAVLLNLTFIVVQKWNFDRKIKLKKSQISLKTDP